MLNYLSLTTSNLRFLSIAKNLVLHVTSNKKDIKTIILVQILQSYLLQNDNYESTVK